MSEPFVYTWSDRHEKWHAWPIIKATHTFVFVRWLGETTVRLMRAALEADGEWYSASAQTYFYSESGKANKDGEAIRQLAQNAVARLAEYDEANRTTKTCTRHAVYPSGRANVVHTCGKEGER